VDDQVKTRADYEQFHEARRLGSGFFFEKTRFDLPSQSLFQASSQLLFPELKSSARFNSGVWLCTNNVALAGGRHSCVQDLKEDARM
jgi:hypothetical protein